MLRADGNAVDAAIASVLASFAVESPLTGFGAGGFMMVHGARTHPTTSDRGSERASKSDSREGAGGEEGVGTYLIDFFVAAPGLDGVERGADLVAVPVHFDAETVQTFYVGPASCGVPGTAAGLALALERFGSMPLSELGADGIRLAREGAPVNAEQAYILDILAPIHARLEGTRELYAPGGHPLREGDTFRFPELAEDLERFGAEGVEPFYRGEVAATIAEFVAAAGGAIGAGDLAAYRAIEREPIRAGFRGTEVLTNPPPSSGGHPDRLLPRPARAAGRAQRPRAAGRGDGRRQPGPGRGVRRGALRGGPQRRHARPGRARPQGGRPARLDDPHLGPRRRGDVRRASPAPTAPARASWCRGPG